jgi:integrase
MEKMARRRFQYGSVRLRGVRRKVWVGKWREDVILPGGTVKRIQKGEIIGTLDEYKTKRLAARALQQRLADVNSTLYKPRPTATFREFSQKWIKDVLSLRRRSTQAADKSRLTMHLIPYFGDAYMKDMARDQLQSFIAMKATAISSKSVRNLIILLRQMWVQAKADGYSQVDIFYGLVMPSLELSNQPCLTLDEMKLIINNSPEPYKTFYWILAETGVRCGELCGLPVRNLLLDLGAIKITQKVWHGKIEPVKSLKGNRICEVSPQLVAHVRGFLESWKPNPDGLLFSSSNGTPWDADVLRKRKFYPLLEKLNIVRCGFHAFRHGNETVMDGENVPIATRLNRLDHSDPRTTMKYTHVVSQDGRQFSERLGTLLTAQPVLEIAENV